MQEKTVFSTLNAVNCNEHTERKGNLTYLSWAWAWQIVKVHYPEASYTIYESPDGWNYFTDGRTCWVKVGYPSKDLSTSSICQSWMLVTNPFHWMQFAVQMSTNPSSVD